MTIGSILSDFPASAVTTTFSPPSSYVYGSVFKYGAKFEKTWNGTNYPALKPVYEVFTFTNSKGKVLRGRRRVDVPTRSRIEDHPYSCTIAWTRHSAQTATYYAYAYRLENAVQVKYWYVASVETRIDGNGSYVYRTDSGWDANDDIALIGKLRERIAGSDFNMGVALGEGREALTMISNSATRIFRALRAVKRGHISLAIEVLGVKDLRKAAPLKRKTAAQNWLELQYGWLPLLKDVHGASQFLAKQLEFPLIQSYRVRKVKPYTYGGWPYTRTDVAAYGFHRKQIIARLTEANVAKLAGLTDPASVAWELLPFSFIADWFIPIGNYLAARSLASALTGSFVTTGTIYTYQNVGDIKAISTETERATFANGGGSRRFVSVTRTVSSNISIPLPAFKRLSDVPSWKRAANAVSLLVLLAPKLRS